MSSENLTFEQLFGLEPVTVPHDVLTVRDYMTRYDAEDSVAGWWSFDSCGGYPYTVAALNLAAMRDGRLARMVADDAHDALHHGTVQETDAVY